MKVNKSLLFFILLFSNSILFAQLNPLGQCGVLTDMQNMDRLIENQLLVKNIDFERKGAVYFIPIKLHLVARTDGTGRLSEKRAMEGICKLNEYFAPMDMQFYLKGDFNHIDNDVLYDLEYPSIPFAARALYRSNKVDEAANVFIGNGLSSGNSGYYTSGQDIIYMDKQYVNNRDNILAHEFGHFFSLAHTFFGWEGRSYDSSSPTPTQWNGIEVEYVDREKNCETAADRFCGTPADYINDWSGPCNYSGGAVDPDSVQIDPDEANLMAYYSFTGCTEYHFSEDQQDVIVADYLARTDMSSLPSPTDMPVTDLPVLQSPVDGEAVQPGSEVLFEWEATPNATRYLVEISPLANFAFLEKRVFTNELSYSTNELNTNRPEYYWRVWALNDVHFCETQYSEPEKFVFGDPTSVTDYPLLEKLSVSPNPSSGDEISVQFYNFNLSAPTIALEIFDLTGKSVFRLKNQPLYQGENEVSLPVSGLESGIYFLKIYSSGILIGKEKIVRF